MTGLPMMAGLPGHLGAFGGTECLAPRRRGFDFFRKTAVVNNPVQGVKSTQKLKTISIKVIWSPEPGFCWIFEWMCVRGQYHRMWIVAFGTSEMLWSNFEVHLLDLPPTNPLDSPDLLELFWVSDKKLQDLSVLLNFQWKQYWILGFQTVWCLKQML